MTDTNKGAAGLDRFTEPMRQAGERMRESSARVTENTQSLNLKVLEQAEQNAREAFAAMREAATAKSLSEVMEVHNRYIREQSSRGMDQIREVGEMIQRFGRDAIEPLTNRDAGSGSSGGAPAGSSTGSAASAEASKTAPTTD